MTAHYEIEHYEDANLTFLSVVLDGERKEITGMLSLADSQRLAELNMLDHGHKAEWSSVRYGHGVLRQRTQEFTLRRKERP